MKHRILSLLLALVIAALPLTCCAEAIGDYEINVYEDDCSYILAYHGSEANLVLPDSFVRNDDECPLAGIEGESFIYNSALETIVIPEGVTTIGYRAFYGCENLTTVVLPSTVDWIDDEAFAHCSSLTQINLPAEMYYVGTDAFAGCDALVLTDAQESTVADTTTARFNAEQEAFVVDPENMTELSGYLGVDIYQMPELLDGLSEEYFGEGAAYGNDGATFYSFTMWGLVSEIRTCYKSNFSLCGVYVTMESQDALRTLLKSGWKMTDKWDGAMSFEDANGNKFYCYLDGDDAVESATLEANYDLLDGILAGLYGAEELLNYESEAIQATSATARTTAEVNMRSGAGTGYDVVCAIPADTTVDYLGESSTDDRGVVWYHIRCDGMTGWSSSKYVELQ